MRLAFIPFLLLIIPIMEIAAFIFIGGQIGIGWTLLMILVTAIGGTFLLRRQGMGLVNRVQTEMGEGRVPGQALPHLRHKQAETQRIG
ncbi:MAG: FxsA family protein, partial [Pseudomonadota bacterium]